jgi:hypothetical protein
MLTRYPLVNLQRAIENGPVEIVDLPIKMVDFSIVILVYQRAMGKSILVPLGKIPLENHVF